jgi:hypothetical protein
VRPSLLVRCPARPPNSEHRQAAAQQSKKANILFIMGDDIGIMNVGAYHQGLMVGETPNIDRVAAEGAKFMTAYAEQSCTAGRTSFATGMNPLRAGMIMPQLPRSTSSLLPGTPRDLGYNTGEFGFKTFIVSGGGVEFMRPCTEQVYGVPPEQVVGSSIKTKFEMRDGRPLLFRLPEINFIDDKAGKPVGINQYIGRRPIAAFGNSDGDLEMLQWTTLIPKRRLGLIVHHTDAEREYAYDRKSSFGHLDVALDAAALNRWTVVDMKNDWKTIFPGETQK